MTPLTDRTGGEGFHTTPLTKVIPSLTRASQSASLLIQLPAELRLQVLRYLLVAETPIKYRQQYRNSSLGRTQKRKRDARGRFVPQDSPAEGTPSKRMVRGYRISPSVIRTCQHIFAEALPILYNENTLHITIVAFLHSPSALTPSPIDANGQFCKDNVTAAAYGLGNEHILILRSGDEWSCNEDLANLARQFRNFLLSVNSEEFTRQLAQTRRILRFIAPIVFASNVKSTITPGHRPLPPPLNIVPTTEITRLIKAFTLLRCANFHLAGIFGPVAASVQDVINGSTPILDLEEFLPSPGRMLSLLVTYLNDDPLRCPGLRTLMRKLAKAVGSFDVKSFLRARFKILRTWQHYVTKKKRIQLKRNGRYKGDVPEVFEGMKLMTVNLEEFHVCNSTDLGLEVLEDGYQLNAKLRNLAKQHKFTPKIDS